MFTRQSRTDSGKLDDQRHTSTDNSITHSIEHIVRFMLRLPLLPAQLRLDCHILTPGDSYTRLLVIVRIYI